MRYYFGTRRRKDAKKLYKQNFFLKPSLRGGLEGLISSRHSVFA